MLPEVMDYYGVHRDFRHTGYFATEAQQQLSTALKAGIVGSGKTTLLHRVQDELMREKEVLVARSLAVDKARVELRTLIMALFYDLATEKDVKIPTQPETRERQLLDLISKRRKPIALFIDEAHALPGKTLTELKRLMELVQQQGDRLAVILAGHPKLQHDLRRPAMEEIGARASVFTLEGIKGYQRDYIVWLLEQCTDAPGETVLTPRALAGRKGAGITAGTACGRPATVSRPLSQRLGPDGCYRAVVPHCAPIIGEGAPAGIAIIAEGAPAIGAVIALSRLAYRAVTAMRSSCAILSTITSSGNSAWAALTLAASVSRCFAIALIKPNATMSIPYVAFLRPNAMG
jgi:type II secretory pathway predicted ATPase ExeA